MRRWNRTRFFALVAMLSLTWTFFPVQALAVKIVIDPGHGGSDPGAIGVNGLLEKTINLDIAHKVANQLRTQGYDVAMTRESDQKMSLQQRVEFKEREQADLFVSIHANWNRVPRIDGVMVLYYDNAYPQASYPASPEMKKLSAINKRFAQTVLHTITSQIDTADRGLLPSSVYVVRNGTMPSILVETAFLSNAQDAAKLADERYRAKMAKAIADGIYAFMPIGFADTAGHWAQKSILRLKEHGIVEGTGKGFAPEQSLTRAEFLAMANRAFAHVQHSTVSSDANAERMSVTKAVYAGEDPAATFAFTDLSDQHWAYEYFRKAAVDGFILGYPDGTVRPDDRISRSEVAALFDRMWRQGEEVAAPQTIQLHSIAKIPFRDISDQHWSYVSVHRLWSYGLLNGYQPDRFEPDRYMTRAEAATFIDRFIEKHNVIGRWPV